MEVLCGRVLCMWGEPSHLVPLGEAVPTSRELPLVGPPGAFLAMWLPVCWKVCGVLVWWTLQGGCVVSCGGGLLCLLFPPWCWVFLSAGSAWVLFSGPRVQSQL